MKNPMTPAGIETATLRFVAQHTAAGSTTATVTTRATTTITTTTTTTITATTTRFT